MSRAPCVVTRSRGGVPLMKSAGETTTEKGVAVPGKSLCQLCLGFTSLSVRVKPPQQRLYTASAAAASRDLLRAD